ncbi:CRISPR-associated protein Cas6/Cse3/CasE, subtype I-E/ECOLI [uncultured Defluviicoccus sp.]|uniref:CRISPR-associated protein Cas6/Cse3/CasE, subtype I-E/ECOLI n=1 Tax=metagenome TaxID=256318 RepID=A0A380TKM7_9ZZZZ|nr:CRISPR-associated protein Cas6/Cse3/CasE, subtype I-E/ECOLI [uncultured Defluviicoccus sp.]
MSPPLHMLKLEPDMRRLAAWVYARRLAGRDGDLGYALHAALAAAFGEAVPKPFRLREPRCGSWGDGAGLPALYGYCAADELALKERAALAEPDVHAALGLDTLAVKPMPTHWTEGRQLDFEVRIRPVVRCDRAGDRASVRERDAFLAVLPPATTAGSANGFSREEVYRQWLTRELGRDDAAVPLASTLRMIGFHRTRVQRRGRPAEDGRRTFGPSLEGPDALFTGVLEVNDGGAFAMLIRRGIGRHRAFGFGMLLLRPARVRTPC